MVPFTSTAGFSHFSSHSSLFTTTDEFYVIVKAIDLSMQESTVSTGPISIDVTRPATLAAVNESLDSTIENNLMIISWDEWDIVDEEDIFPLTYEYAIGKGNKPFSNFYAK